MASKAVRRAQKRRMAEERRTAGAGARGPLPKPGDREPNGRLSRRKTPKEAADKVALAARARHMGLTVEQAKDQKAVDWIGALAIHGQKGGGISLDQHKAIETYRELRRQALQALKAPGEPTTHEASGGGDTISPGYVAWAATVRNRYDAAKAAIREAQNSEYRSSNLYGALDHVIHRGERHEHMIGDVRSLGNVLHRHFKLDRVRA